VRNFNTRALQFQALGEAGDLSARLEVEYPILLTQRLIVQP
jgi:uncharacterized protein involved in copper resistance